MPAHPEIGPKRSTEERGVIMDISETTAPRSDQQNYEDYLGGVTRTVTVTGVTKGSLEQPVSIELAEFPGRPYKPNKTFRRVLVLCWGSDSAAYIGRRLTLCGNPEVVFGGKAVGGVEIQSLSHIDKPMSIPLTVTRGKKKNFTVTPLKPSATEAPTVDDATANEWTETFTYATTLAALQAAWESAGKAGATADPRIIAAKDARKRDLA